MPIEQVGRAGRAGNVVKIDDKLFPKTEVKISIDPADVDNLFSGLDLKNVSDVRKRDVFFFDTPAQDLRNAGLLLRARVGDGDDDVTIKARGQPIATTAAKLYQNDDDAKPEIDRTSKGPVPSVSVKEDVSDKKIKDVVAGRHGPRTLYSTKLERQLEELLGRRPPWERMKTLGPVETTAWKLKPAGMSEDIVVEKWRFPNGKEIVEISAKGKTADAQRLHTELNRLLKKHDVDPSNAVETKTNAVYDAFMPQPSASSD